MSVDERSVDHIQLVKLVGWLDEQRKLDKEVIARLSQQMEKVTQETRDTAAQLSEVHERLKQAHAGLAHMTVVDSSIRQVREQISEVQRLLQDTDQRAVRGNSLNQAESARLAKVTADLAQQVDEVDHRFEALQSRLQLVGEELKQDRAKASALPQRIENIEKQASSQAGRWQLAEEQLRRADGQLTAFEQAREAMQGELRRLWQWQQSAELRWARQLAEWAQQIEQWQTLQNDQSQLLQNLVHDSTQVKEQLNAHRRDVDRQHDLLDEYQDALVRMESAQEVSREEINLLLQESAAQRKRDDDEALRIQQIDGKLTKESANLAALNRRLDAERARIDELTKAAQQHESDQRGDRGELGRLEHELRDLAQRVDDATAKVNSELEGVRQSQRSRLAEAMVIQERQLSRQIDELEQQVHELREQRDALAGHQTVTVK